MLAAPMLLATSFPIMAKQADEWRFKVYLNDKEIGYHTVTLKPMQDGSRVQTAANFDVKFLFLNAFRYEHKAEELWRGDCLRSIRTSTSTNGENQFVEGENNAGRLTLTTNEGEKRLEGCVRSFAYWDLDLLESDRLLNPQTGRHEDVKLEEFGLTTKTINGSPVEALRYRLLTEESAIDLWYTPDYRWLALESEVKSGKRLSYVPVETDA
jgi:hypothetical protein